MNVTNPVVRFSQTRGRTGRFLGPAESSFRIFSPELTKKIKKSPMVCPDFQKSLIKHTKFKVWISMRPKSGKSPSPYQQIINEKFSPQVNRSNFSHQRHYSAVRRSMTPLSSSDLTIKKLTPSTPRYPTKVLQKKDLRPKIFSPIRGPTPLPESEGSIYSSSSSETLKSRLYTNP
jgi:hypothetical protein